MKSYLISALFVLTTLSACNKISPENYADAIIGQWQGVKEEYYENGILTETEFFEESMFITFASNGNYFIESDGYIEDSGTFVVSDTYLTMESLEYGKPHTTILKIQSLNEKELVIVDSDGYKGYEEWAYLIRVR